MDLGAGWKGRGGGGGEGGWLGSKVEEGETQVCVCSLRSLRNLLYP